MNVYKFESGELGERRAGLTSDVLHIISNRLLAKRAEVVSRMNVKAGFSGTTRLATEPVNECPVPSKRGRP